MPESVINNEIYHDLGHRWYTAKDDPVALLRAEAKTKNPWVKNLIERKMPHLSPDQVRILDIGCGAGFLTNSLVQEGYKVTGLDTSVESMNIAREYDGLKKVDYVAGDAYKLPFPESSFEVVTCMDFLEHVEDPERVIREASRVLSPRGIFVFHTFNRNWLSGLVIIKGVEWFVKNTPPNLHVLDLFLKPEEVEASCRKHGLKPQEMVGIAPDLRKTAFWKMLLTREVPDDFSFRINGSTRLAYLGHAVKNQGKRKRN